MVITSLFMKYLAKSKVIIKFKLMNYSTEQEDYLMTTPYTKKIQKKFKEVKNFLEKNGFNSSSQGLMQDIISSQEYISKNDL